MRKISWPNRKLRKATATYAVTLMILKTTNTETQIDPDHTLKYPEKLVQEKGHCKTKDYIP
jgi:hypothetical protein